MIDDVSKLEHILCAYARPVFLAITQPDEDNDIQIVISAIAFKTMSVPGRVGYVFNLIKTHAPDLLKDRLIVVQAYSPSEMEEVMDKLLIPEAFEPQE